MRRSAHGNIIKAVLAVPVLYFSFVGLIVTLQGRGLPDQQTHKVLGTRAALQGHPPHEHDLEDPVEAGFHANVDAARRQASDVFPQRRNEPLQPPGPLDEEDIQLQLRLNDERHRQERQKQQLQADQAAKQLRTGKMGGGGVGAGFQYKGGEAVAVKGANGLFIPTNRPGYDPNAPGEQGRGVEISKDKLSESEKKIYDLGFTRNAFNQYASDMMSIHRNVPDIRDAECKKQTYPPYSELPDTSVVIIFHNEAWSVLLRTVHSVLDRSPPQLIREVILVDDFSDFDHLGKPLEDYVNHNVSKVRLVRAPKREGLIRARLRGASVAKGKSITFLDSHCECTPGWLEPLLARIHEDASNVVCPVIDVIDDQTLRYQSSSAKATSVGGFDWNLQFNWHAIPESEKKRRARDIDPVRSPTMAGGLFSIDREYFEYLGTYDPGMDIWGGENLELSFRVWMCGGALEILPCSHVGHIFRKRSPYSWKTGVNVVKKNSIRLAEVWMDEYKHYYYERFNNDLGDFGDVAARKELRKRLNCRSFHWYIQNIFPELFVPGEAVASGEIRSKVQPQCLDSPVDSHSMQKPIKMWPCHLQGGNQFWMMSISGEIRRDEGCMDYAGQFVMIYPCHGMKGNQEWVYGPDNTLRHRNTNLCIELRADGQAVEMKPCTGIDAQIWKWQRRKPDHEDGEGENKAVARR